MIECTDPTPLLVLLMLEQTGDKSISEGYICGKGDGVVITTNGTHPSSVKLIFHKGQTTSGSFRKISNE